MIARRLLMMLALTFAASGCTQPNPGYDPDPSLPGECRRGAEVSQTFSAWGRPEKLDVLFIVDASGEVTALQEVLANAVTQFGELLRTSNVDVRFAVTTTNATGTVELAGPSESAPGCDGNDGVVADLSKSDWSDTLRCNLLLGPRERAFDMPLLVFDDLLAAGAGNEFFRPDARMLVIVASMDDDCSSEGELDGMPTEGCAARERDLIEPRDLVAGWRAAREDPDGLGFVVFGGTPSGLAAKEGRPACSSSVGSVRPANRLFRAVDAFDGQGFFHSACTDDFVAPLAAVADEFVDDAVVTLCLASTSEHEPLSVLASNEEEEDPIGLGERDGFVYLGPTEACPTGGLQFSGRALRGYDQVEIDYCTTE